MMTRSLHALVAVSLLLGSSMASAQDSDELLPLPPLDETFPAELVEEESESAIWMPSIVRNTTGPVVDFFREGTFVYDSEAMFLNASPDPNDDTIFAAELQFGWENPAGWGVRGEYFWFTQEWTIRRNGGGVGTPITGNPWNHLPNAIGSVLVDHDADNVHLDGYRRFSTDTTELVFGGGLSFISYDQKFMNAFETGPPGGDYAFDVSREFMSGVGGSVMGEFRRPLIVRDSWEIATLGNGRSAIVPGELEVRSSFVDVTMDNTLWLNKAALGLEYVKRFKRITVSLRGLGEWQHWNSDVLADQSFTGGSVSLGLDW